MSAPGVPVILKVNSGVVVGLVTAVVIPGIAVETVVKLVTVPVLGVDHVSCDVVPLPEVRT